ncbi:MAG: class A beta-lactamase-related serine hydrolase [Candidatus Omnitrophica bacterium]|nr:class A beta-lactamase-related serine hydrolase [Candidatus Omnitrophota bacterium]
MPKFIFGKKIVVYIFLLMCLTWGIYAVSAHLIALNTQIAYQNDLQAQKEKAHDAELKKRKAAWKALKKNIALEILRFKGTSGIIIKDLDKDWELYHNKTRLFKSASLVKIPIMCAYFYAAAEHKVDLQQKIQLKRSDITSGSGILKGMPIGTSYTLDNLIRIMVTESDNTASNILINNLGFNTLNGYFKKLGLKDTNLSRKMMDFKARKRGVENYSSPRDMALLLQKVYDNKLVSPSVSEKVLRLLAGQKINDRIPRRLPKGTVIAHKTGLEQGACHDVGIVFTDRGNFLICALTEHPYQHAYLPKQFIAKVAALAYHYYDNF